MATKIELEKQLKETDVEYQKVIDKLKKRKGQFDPVKHKDETRSVIALFVVKSYFYIMAASLFFVPLYNYKAYPDVHIDIIDLIMTLSGIVGTAFGFVVGYYFKGSERN